MKSRAELEGSATETRDISTSTGSRKERAKTAGKNNPEGNDPSTSNPTGTIRAAGNANAGNSNVGNANARNATRGNQDEGNQSAQLLPKQNRSTETEVKSESIADGFTELRNGELTKALSIFNNIARERPDSAEAHYGRARTLAQMGRREDAIKEFRLTLLLNPVEELAKVCQEHLATITKPPEKPKGPIGAPATVHPQDVEGSIAKILRQSEDKIRDIQTSSESFATNVYNGQSDAHDRQMEQARREAEEMKRAYGRRGRHYLDAEVNRQLAERQYKAQYALGRSKSDFEMRKNEAEMRSLGVKQSAEGLESQMMTKPSDTSGVILLPTGTNLYVRNYAHFDPIFPEPPEALHAVPLKLPQVLKIVESETKKEEARKDESKKAEAKKRDKASHRVPPTISGTP